MTSPQAARGAPPFDTAAADAIAAARGGSPRRTSLPPLTDAEKAEAEKAAEKAPLCQFCLGYHALPGSPGCPRLASFRLDGDGKVAEGTFFPGTRWAKGRVVFLADTKEDDGEVT